MGTVDQALTQALRISVETEKKAFFLFKNEMEFRLCLILSLCLMANGLPNETKTGAQLRVSDNIDTTSLRSGDQPANGFSTSFPVRLIHGATGIIGGKSGRLQVCIGGQWGTVNDDYSPNGNVAGDQPNNNVAMVVCRMLGFAGGRVVTTGADQQFGDWEYGRILASNVHCMGNEADISQCRMTWTGHEISAHGDDLGIVCD